ncbi:hypothetical protein HPB52_011540 [Rhipicephalus sanguineus]|uniref:Secreted protein n=1 Tax=Rhipicephalus sanguineus TaxID=34632 RepID=A0A9D4T3N9_RHISA|nr:hypothetical protein HPB52_011540 [Rhipicephalus sanguineus]
MAASLGFTLLVLFAVPLLGKCELSLKPGCKVETLRACGDDFIPYKKGPHLHESGQEFDEGCNSYSQTVDCLYNALAPCKSVGAQDYMVGIVEEMFGETLNLVCGRYKKGSTECKSLPQLPRLGAKDRRLDNVVEILLEAAGTLGRKN